MRVLQTQRLQLRWLEVQDAPFVLELQSEPDWKRYIGDRGVDSLPTALDYIQAVRANSYLRHGFGLYAMQRLADAATVGLCGLIKRDALEHVDLGFALLARYTGAGLAAEAAAATLDYARDRLGLRRIAAIAQPDNARSIRLLERLGMRLEGQMLLPGETQNLCYYLTPDRG